MVNSVKRLKARLKRVKNQLFAIPAILLIYRTIKELSNIDGANKAAGVAYYAILSIFPLLLGLVALFGFLLPSLNIQDQLLLFIGNNLPGATDIIKQNLESIIRLRGVLGVLSIVILFWSGSTMFSAVSLAINRAWDIRRVRPFYIRKASELAISIGTGILFLLSLGASTVISILGKILNQPAADLIIVNLSSRLAAFILMLVVFLLLYKIIPNTRTYWRYTWPGAILAAVLFEFARTLFILYIQNFANYQLIYGSISSIIILLIWIFYSAFILILGAEFTFQYSRLRQGLS